MAAKSGKRKYSELDKESVQRLVKQKSDSVTMVPLSIKSKFKDFERINIDSVETRFVTCSTCKDQKLYRYDNITGSSSVTYHSDTHKKPNDEKETIKSFVYQSSSIADKAKVSKAAVKLCAFDQRPFTVVEGDGMMAFVDTIIQIAAQKGRINPKELLPCADTVKNHFVATATETRDKMKQELAKVPFINCTTDHWKELDTNQDFMTITIHYFDPTKSSLTNRVIGTFAVDNKTSAAIENYFTAKLNEFDAQHKLRIVVSDNASAMKKAFQNCEWIGCCAHNLSLVQSWTFNQKTPKETPDPLPAITMLLDSVKSIVTQVKKSGINKKLNTKLRQSGNTRWDSNYDMCKSVLDNLDILDNEPSLQSDMDNIQRGLLKELCEFLKPFKEMRVLLCSDTNPTIHAVILSFYNLNRHIDSFQQKNLVMILVKQRMKQFMKEKFHISPMHYIATFLFPKYRSTPAPTEKIRKEGLAKLRSFIEEVQESDEEQLDPVPNRNNQCSIVESVFDQYAEKPGNDIESDEIEAYKNFKLTTKELITDDCPFKFWTK